MHQKRNIYRKNNRGGDRKTFSRVRFQQQRKSDSREHQKTFFGELNKNFYYSTLMLLIFKESKSDRHS